jgi:hypothetical protein
MKYYEITQFDSVFKGVWVYLKPNGHCMLARRKDVLHIHNDIFHHEYCEAFGWQLSAHSKKELVL